MNHYYLLILGALCSFQNSLSSLPPHKRPADQSENAPPAKKIKLLLVSQEDPQDMLLQGLRTQNLELIKKAFDHGAQPNVVLDNKTTPLTSAASKLRLDIVQELVRAGADVNQPDKLGQTPLTASIKKHDNSEPLSLFLLENGARVDLPDKFGTPLLFAITNSRIHLAKKLISMEASVNFTHKKKEYSLLAQAIASNKNKSHDEIIQLLLQKGAVIDFKPKKQGTITPIEASISHLNNNLAKQFIKKNQVTVSKNLLNDAFKSGNEEMAYIILSELPQLNNEENIPNLHLDHVRFGLAVRQAPPNLIEETVAKAYKIKQMIRAKQIELLEIE